MQNIIGSNPNEFIFYVMILILGIIQAWFILKIIKEYRKFKREKLLNNISEFLQERDGYDLD